MKSLFILLSLLFCFEAMAARTAFTVQTASEISALVGFASVNDTDGNKFVNYGNALLICENLGASAAVVTVPAQNVTKVDPAYGTLTKSNAVMNLAAGEMEVMGPFAKVAFNDSTGNVLVNYSGVGAPDIDCVVVK